MKPFPDIEVGESMLKLCVYCIVYTQSPKSINYRVLMGFHQPIPFSYLKALLRDVILFINILVCKNFPFF